MTDRTRIVTWDDPMIPAQRATEMRGIDFLRTIIAGDIPAPPIAHLLGMRLVEVEEGRAVFTIEPGEYLYNPIGTVHGGVACTLLDSALGCAVQSTLDAGVGYTTVELHTNMLRPVTVETGLLRAEAEVIHVGRRLATAQGKLVDAQGKIYAHATTTCMILAP